MREPQEGDVIAGKYRIDAPLGRGGMGMVLSATHTFTHRRLAVKWMLPELAEEPGAVERFLREARASARIDHPNVVRVYDVGQHESSLFMVMELLEGEPLSGALARGPLEPSACVALMLQVARGVGAAHAQGIVHRDIKPDNIFLCKKGYKGLGEPKVLDFGISKLTEGVEPGSHTLTGTHTVLGTPYYMSKEQMTRSKGVDQRTDIYALGVVMYQALTGALPFDGDTYGALAVAIATETPRPVRELRADVSPALAEVVARAMAREPEHRYDSVEALAAALEKCKGAGAITTDLALAATQPSSPGMPRLTNTSTPMGTEARERVSAVPGQRRTGVFVLVGALAIAGAAALALLPGRDAQPPPALGVAPAEAPPAAVETHAAATDTPGVAQAPEEGAQATPDAGAATDTPAAELAAPTPAPKAKQPPPSSRTHAKRTARRAKREHTQATQAVTSPSPAPTPQAAPPPPRPASTPNRPRKARAGDMSLDDFL